MIFAMVYHHFNEKQCSLALKGIRRERILNGNHETK